MYAYTLSGCSMESSTRVMSAYIIICSRGVESYVVVNLAEVVSWNFFKVCPRT